jgi:hypothetical protein
MQSGKELNDATRLEATVPMIDIGACAKFLKG